MPKQTFFNLPEEKRERIIQRAVDEFAVYGYGGFSISRLVEQAGIAKGSFYQYFADKDDLYIYIVEQVIIQRKLSVSSREQPKLAEMNLTEFLRMLFRAMIDEVAADPRALQIGQDLLRHQGDAIYKRLREKYKHIENDYYQSFIREEKERGEIDPLVDVDVLGNMLLGASYLFSSQVARLGAQVVTVERIEEFVDKIAYILTNGIYTGTNSDGNK